MSRSYAAAKRAHLAEPVTFDLTYEVPDRGVDGSGKDAEGQPLPAGAVREQKDTFVCRGAVTTLLLAEFARQADLDTATPEGMALIADFFRQAFGTATRRRRSTSASTAR